MANLGDIEKVNRLIQLAGSPNEHEARNAAYEACRLIRTLKLLILAPSALPPPRPGAWPVHSGGTNEILKNATKKHRQENPGFVEDILGKMGIPVVGKANAGDKKRIRPVVMASPMTTPIQMKAKFMGKCEDCQKPYTQGASVWYRRGVGCVHVTCDPGALV